MLPLRRRRRLSRWLATRCPRGHIPRDATLPGIDSCAFFESRQTAQNDGARRRERCKVLTYDLQCKTRLLRDLQIEPLPVFPQAVQYYPSLPVAMHFVAAGGSFRVLQREAARYGHFVFMSEVERVWEDEEYPRDRGY